MPRVTSVKRARKEQGSCGSCRTIIKKGDPYKWLKKRYGSKKIRCENCIFRASDHTGGRLGEVYAAVEDAEDQTGDWEGDPDDLRAILSELSDNIRNYAQEYQDSADSIREHFTDSEKADECEEKAQELEGWADEIEITDIDDYEGPAYDPTDEKAEVPEEWEAWIEDQRSVVADIIGNCPL